MRRLLPLAAVAAAFAVTGTTGFGAASVSAPPAAPARPVVDTYHGQSVSDPFRWLENGADPSVKTWMQAQTARVRTYLDSLASRAAISSRLADLMGRTSPSYYSLDARGGKIFALYNQPPKQQPMLAVMDEDADPARARVILDPNQLNPKGTTAIDWYVPSHDGKLVAVSLSENGSEDGNLYIYDTTTGVRMNDVIEHVQYPTGGGSVAWTPDGKGLWYTKYTGADRSEADKHFYEQVYFHTIGADRRTDRYVLGREFPKVAEVFFSNRDDPNNVLVTVLNGDGGEVEHFIIRAGSGEAVQVTRFEDKVVGATIGPDGSLYMVSRLGAPNGKVLKLPLSNPVLSRAVTIVPAGDRAIDVASTGIAVTRTSLFVQEVDGGPSRVRILSLEGRPLSEVPLPGIASVGQMERVGEDMLFSITTYLEPTYWARFVPGRGAAPTKLRTQSPVDFSDIEAVREFATSPDGTKIPVNIIRKKGTVLDGNNPTILYGYGGYGINLSPSFLGAWRRIWFDAGGVYAIANIRGGGEYGERWHLEGNLTKKQNVFDDFAAAAKLLVDRKYTNSAKLALMGGSNGGLLMGATLTQHPDIARAVVSSVGIYDMLRVELDPNGLFNTPEFGTVTDAAQFRALYAYSPYHHVRDGVKYPALFLYTGENDGRVNPMQSRKFAARLQTASPGSTILLKTSGDSGHGIGSALSARIEEYADNLAFLFDQLGVK